MTIWRAKILQPCRKLQADELLNERIRLESISMSIASAGVIVITLVMFFIFPKDLPQSRYMGLWLGSQLLANSSWLLFVSHHKTHPTPKTTRLFPYLSTAISSFTGFMWGGGWAFFVGTVDSAHVLAAVIFTIVLGGVFTGGVLATLFHLPSLLSFTLLALFPPLISTLVCDGLFHIWFGITLVVYMLVCTAFALNLNAFLLDTLERREEKAWLALQLEAEKQRVEQASRDKTRFLAAASHDLRQPLQALQFFQQALGELLPTGGQEQQLLDKIKASSAALNSLLNSLLDISKLDTGIQDIDWQTFPAGHLLQQVYQQYAPLVAVALLIPNFKSVALI